MKLSKGNHPITSVDLWRVHAPPKDVDKQWVDGYSAKELAKAFCEPNGVCVPSELQGLLDSSPILGRVELCEAWPEKFVSLDDFGGPRNADLAALGRSQAGLAALNVEAKSDESFGQLIGIEFDKAVAPSNKRKRIDSLAAAIFGTTPQQIRHIRYQLLHAAAASLIFAAKNQADVAMMAVLEFQPDGVNPLTIERNASDLQSFISALSPEAVLTAGTLLGPFSVPGSGRVPGNLPLYVGKAIRPVAARPPRASSARSGS